MASDSLQAPGEGSTGPCSPVRDCSASTTTDNRARQIGGDNSAAVWPPGSAPVAVIMITLNEAHNLDSVLANLTGWAQEVHVVDSLSVDDTVGIALRHGAHVVQRQFRGFGDQWNFALRWLPIKAAWTMKMDPDERLTDELKREIEHAVTTQPHVAYRLRIRLYFMGTKLPSVLRLTRLWRTGSARFSNVQANEHAHVDGPEGELRSELRHLDSPDLDHWLNKQNRYTTAEAVSQYRGAALAASARLFGTRLERRMWVKRHFWRVPGRYVLLFLYHLFVIGAWRAGRVGWIWARLRTEVYRLWEYKRYEIERVGRLPVQVPTGRGVHDERVQLFD